MIGTLKPSAAAGKPKISYTMSRSIRWIQVELTSAPGVGAAYGAPARERGLRARGGCPPGVVAVGEVDVLAGGGDGDAEVVPAGAAEFGPACMGGR